MTHPDDLAAAMANIRNLERENRELRETLRDQFAMRAMAGMIGSDAYCEGVTGGWEQDDIAAQSYSMADEMMKERMK